MIVRIRSVGAISAKTAADAFSPMPGIVCSSHVLLFSILLRIYAGNGIGTGVGENNSGFRQHRLVNLISAVLPPLIERLCFSSPR
jgi:hypothetical protein